MFRAMAGDIAGSTFERTPLKTKDFCLHAPNSSHTSDTVLTPGVPGAAADKHCHYDGLPGPVDDM